MKYVLNQMLIYFSQWCYLNFYHNTIEKHWIFKTFDFLFVIYQKLLTSSDVFIVISTWTPSRSSEVMVGVKVGWSIFVWYKDFLWLSVTISWFWSVNYSISQLSHFTRILYFQIMYYSLLYSYNNVQEKKWIQTFSWWYESWMIVWYFCCYWIVYFIITMCVLISVDNQYWCGMLKKNIKDVLNLILWFVIAYLKPKYVITRLCMVKWGWENINSEKKIRHDN